MKMRTAYTTEIDDVEAAVNDVLSQLDQAGGWEKNAIGIISCYFEFIETAVVQALCERLPFDVIGITSIGTATEVSAGMEQLSVTVLTGNDVSFSTAFHPHIEPGTAKQHITETYLRALEKLPGEPALALAFPPIMTDFSGATCTDYLDEVAGKDVLLFGSLSTDSVLTYENARTIWNGEVSRFGFAVALVHGNINPRFFISSIPGENTRKQRAIITDSDDCLLKFVNGKLLLEHMESIGVTDLTPANLTSIPLLIDYGDGSKPIAISAYGFTPEGYAYCGGKVPVGATLTVGKLDRLGIIETAESAIKAAMDQVGAINGIIAVPCFSRALVLSPNTEEELEKTRCLVGDTPLFVSYSGGEICPVVNENSETHNRFHNLSFPVCVF
ncbi:MAG: FIST C-terminal domain-containing protein [Burkholderiaceae bacterium]|jgi:hypothetical protein|nr:FIST C-terminal domain-containing protein [Burkholderiaceae bacterium]